MCVGLPMRFGGAIGNVYSFSGETVKKNGLRVFATANIALTDLATFAVSV